MRALRFMVHVRSYHLRDLLTDLNDRIEANCRVLRNQRNAGPTKSPQFVFAHGPQVTALKPYRSPAMGAGRKEPQQGRC